MGLRWLSAKDEAEREQRHLEIMALAERSMESARKANAELIEALERANDASERANAAWRAFQVVAQAGIDLSNVSVGGVEAILAAARKAREADEISPELEKVITDEASRILDAVEPIRQAILDAKP